MRKSSLNRGLDSFFSEYYLNNYIYLTHNRYQSVPGTFWCETFALLMCLISVIDFNFMRSLNMKHFFAVTVISTALLVGCGQLQDAADDADTTAAAATSITEGVEDSTNTVSDTLDEVSGESSFTFYQKKTSPLDNILQKAYAATCQRTRGLSCTLDGSVGVRESSTSCEFTGRRGVTRTMSGSNRLEYSNTSCQMGVGDSVTRSFTRAISNRRITAIENPGPR